MAATAAKGRAALAVDEARLASAAAAGDGGAFAQLYERYERRAYNLAFRVTGSEEDAADATQDAFLNVMRRLPKLGDRELAFGSYLFTATRNACYDLMEKRRRAQPSDAIPESATPVGAGGGGAAPDPGDPEEDPDRKLLLESQQEEIREANGRLPERQREVLALRELEELSYDEIAGIMEMNRNSVAQLISRARINLRDELRGTALAAIAASAPDCERALPLLAARDDGELDEDSDDAAWLDSHLAGCERCRLGLEAMQEAGVSYRAWVPIAVIPSLLGETMASAAELTGSDWSEAIADAAARRPDPASIPGMPAAYRLSPPSGGRSMRRAIAAAGLAALLLAGLAVVVGSREPAVTPTQNASEPGSAVDEGQATGRAHDRPPKKDAEPASRKAQQPTPEKGTTSKSASATPTTPEQQTAGSQAGAEQPSARPTERTRESEGDSGLRPTRPTTERSPPARPPASEPPPPAEPPRSSEPPTTEPPAREPPPEEGTPEEPRIPGVPPREEGRTGGREGSVP